jgi:hypothetical protein
MAKKLAIYTRQLKVIENDETIYIFEKTATPSTIRSCAKRLGITVYIEKIRTEKGELLEITRQDDENGECNHDRAFISSNKHYIREYCEVCKKYFDIKR